MRKNNRVRGTVVNPAGDNDITWVKKYMGQRPTARSKSQVRNTTFLKGGRVLSTRDDR